MSTTPVEEQDFPRMTRAVQWLIALNVAVFFLQFTLFGAANMQQALGYRFERLPDGWWTVGTHLFVHGGFWQLALNVYMLFLFGPRVEGAWGSREFRHLFIWAGLGGWLAHMLLFRDAMLLGATSAVLGVSLAYALRWADEEVYLFLAIPVRVKWLVATMIGINLAVGVLSTGAGSGAAYLAHLGGLVAAWLFLRTSTGAGIDRLRQRVSSVPDLPDEPPRAVPRSLPRSRERARDVDEIVAQSQQALRSQRVSPSEPAGERTAERQADLDRVLDKISQLGIDSLTSEERKVLEERSRELRRRE
jgi:membrane associated rhomboid family serine protease